MTPLGVHVLVDILAIVICSALLKKAAELLTNAVMPVSRPIPSLFEFFEVQVPRRRASDKAQLELFKEAA